MQPTSTPVAATDLTQPSTWVVSAAGIGPLTLGLTAAELKATQVSGLTVSTSNNCLNGFASSGDSTILAGGTYKTPMTVGFVSVTALDGPHSALGIGVGSTVQDALDAYPGSVFVPSTDDAHGGVRWTTGGTYVVFETDGRGGKSDKISGFTVGLKHGHPQGACP